MRAMGSLDGATCSDFGEDVSCISWRQGTAASLAPSYSPNGTEAPRDGTI